MIHIHILVTGGTGLLGSVICAHLVKTGNEPVAFDLAPKPSQLGELSGRIPVERGDINDLPALVRAIRRHHVEAVIHTAGLLTAAVMENPWQGIQVNYLGTVQILESARLEGVRRVVFCSSSTVYDGAAVTRRPIREDDPVVPRSVYATTKLAAEHTGKNYADLYGLEFIACRLAALYGPGLSQSGVASLWLDPLLRDLIQTGQGRVVRPTRKAMEYLYVEDAAQGLVRAVLADQPLHTAYNIGEGRLTPFDEIIEALSEILPGTRIEEVSSERVASPYAEWTQPMDHTLAGTELGYRSSFPMRQALEHYAGRLHDLLSA